MSHGQLFRSAPWLAWDYTKVMCRTNLTHMKLCKKVQRAFTASQHSAHKRNQLFQLIAYKERGPKIWPLTAALDSLESHLLQLWILKLVLMNWASGRLTSAKIDPGPANLLGQPWTPQISNTKRKEKMFSPLPKCKSRLEADLFFSLSASGCQWLWLAQLDVPLLVRVKMICPPADLCSFTGIESQPCMVNETASQCGCWWNSHQQENPHIIGQGRR